MNWATRIVRPLSSITTPWITSPEHVILTGLCNGILCSQKTQPQWSLSMLYSSAEHWDLSVEEMLKYTEGKCCYILKDYDCAKAGIAAILSSHQIYYYFN